MRGLHESSSWIVRGRFPRLTLATLQAEKGHGTTAAEAPQACSLRLVEQF